MKLYVKDYISDSHVFTEIDKSYVKNDYDLKSIEAQGHVFTNDTLILDYEFKGTDLGYTFLKSKLTSFLREEKLNDLLAT